MNTLTPHIRRYLSERRAAGTYASKSLVDVEARLRTLDSSFGNRPLNQLTRRALERWLATLEHLSTNSRAAYLASVRTFTAWLALELDLPRDPCLGIPKISRPRAVPRAQSAAAVAAVLTACEDSRDRAIVWLMVGCGLRRAEVARIRWEDYDPTAGTLLVVGKAQHERLIPVPSPVADALRPVRTRGATGPIIRAYHGHGVTPGWVGARTSELMRKAGIKSAPYDGVSGHALRHTCASDVLDQCGDLRTVQEMLGHAHLTSTAIYLRRAGMGKMREAMEGRAYRPDDGGPIAA